MLRQEFLKMLSEGVATSQSEETEPLEGKSTETHSSSPRELFTLITSIWQIV